MNDTFRQAGIAVGVAALGALIPAEDALGGGSAAEYVAGLHNALLAGGGLAAVGARQPRPADLQALRRGGGDARRGAAAQRPVIRPRRCRSPPDQPPARSISSTVNPSGSVA